MLIQIVTVLVLLSICLPLTWLGLRLLFPDRQIVNTTFIPCEQINCARGRADKSLWCPIHRFPSSRLFEELPCPNE